MSFDLDKLAAHQTIHITTTGRRSGLPRRVEIWWFRVDGRFIITGTPGRRDWVANLRADPRLTLHVAGRDLEATATFVAGTGITGMVLKVRGDVPGMSADDFQAAAETAKEGCPVSKALKGNVPISLEATLV